MDEFKLSYLRSYVRILKYSQLEEIISFRSDSNRLHKLMLYMGACVQKVMNIVV